VKSLHAASPSRLIYLYSNRENEMVIFVILADFSNFGTNAQNFHNTNFGFNPNILSF
jgi:hypothetical protein